MGIHGGAKKLVIDTAEIRSLFPIVGQLVYLISFEKENITNDYLGWLNNAITVKYSNQRFYHHTNESAFKYLDSFSGGTNLFLAIYLKDSNKYIGTFTVYISEVHETADMGILIGDELRWGSGVGGDAWSAVLSFLIDKVKIRKVTGGAAVNNKAMLNIMIRAGMLPDGVRAAHEIIDSQPVDIAYFAKFNEFN